MISWQYANALARMIYGLNLSDSRKTASVPFAMSPSRIVSIIVTRLADQNVDHVDVLGMRGLAGEQIIGDGLELRVA